MRSDDYVQASILALTNRRLARPDAELLVWCEKQLGFGLSRPIPGQPALFFSDESGERSFVDWFAAQKAAGLLRARLLELADFAREPRVPNGIRKRQLAAFNGSHETVFAAVYPGRVVGWRFETLFPPPTDLRKADVLEFIERSPEREQLRAALIWEDANNLHWGDGESWDELLKAATPERDAALVETFSRCVGNTAVSEATQLRWRDLRRARALHLPPRLRFAAFAEIPQAPPPPATAAAARADLAAALRGAIAFSAAKKLDDWGLVFESALTALNTAAPPEEGGLGAYFERLYGRELGALLTASGAADVFGGMGSWNDLGLDSEPEYARVSDSLFRAVRGGVRAACDALQV